MDNLLAELYGTNEPTGEDFEKVAHLDFLEKIAEEEGIDLEDLSEEELEELAEVAAEAMDDDDEWEGDELEKEAEAKVEEADFLGRVMAHSFTQEMDNIEKEAAKGGFAGFKKRMGKQYKMGLKSAKKYRKRAGKGVSKMDRKVQAIGKRLGARTTYGEMKRRPMTLKGKGAKRVGSFFTAPGRTALEARKASRMSRRLRGYGALGAGAAGLGAAAYGASRLGEEKRSADAEWEDAIQSRAWEHLVAAGLADDTGNFIPAERLNKTAGNDMDYEVDAAALELLEAEGYPVEWY